MKITLDGIFGAAQFRNEIIWRRNVGVMTSRSQRFPRNHDSIYWYARGEKNSYNKQFKPYKDSTLSGYNRDDHDGRGSYATRDLRDYSDDSVKKFASDNRIHTSKTGNKRLKVYLSEKPGNVIDSVWEDIQGMGNVSRKERTGYPTQKPIALLRRIIKAASNPGDKILDPFCGCATACIAAEQEGREWIGIDISPQAFPLVRQRLEDELGLLNLGINHRTDIPQERGGKRTANTGLKKRLYGEQGGNCRGCGVHFEPRNLTLDHFIPTAKGGPDIDANIQLLCGACNSLKGDRPMAFLEARLEYLGMKGFSP